MTITDRIGDEAPLAGAHSPRPRARRRSPTRRPRGLRLSRRDRLLLWLALVPAVGILGFAQAYPLAYSLYMSFVHWSLADSLSPQGFAGLANFRQLFASPDYTHALRLSALFLVTVPVELAIGFVLAYFTQGERLLMRVIRTLLIIPMVVAPIAVGTMFRLLFEPQSGLLVLLMRAVGLPEVNWLGSQNPAVIVVLGTHVWEGAPFAMIVYAAALTGIDRNLIDAARVDRASAMQVVRHVIIPLLMPATLVICVFRVVDAFLVIDAILGLTGGGPGTATRTSSLWIFNEGLRYFNLSEGAAGSWVVVVICVAMAVAVLRVRDRVIRRSRGSQ